MMLLSFMTRGAIARTAAIATAANGSIPSPSRTRPKSRPKSANKATNIARGAISIPSIGLVAPIFSSFCVDIVFPSSFLGAA